MASGNCPLASEKDRILLLDYCAGELASEQAAVLRAHVDACPQCLDFVAAQASIGDALDTWEAPPVSAGFDARLHARIAEETGGQPWWRWLYTVLELRPAAAVAAICVMIAAGILLNRVPEPVAQPEQARIESARESAPEVESVEQTLEDLEMLRLLPVNGGGSRL
ncbi:MAG: zf-HC2 domain-containing protein [Bryobacteraceae bacterium]|nr:zf-HC2 domain-containing protein [Bryobacteraceae bacterium]